ncbi:MAG: hypothetical protein PHP57_00085 [Sideroxydans sp.]|nr:hypothetical protein [Sideroxydans sp.]
MGPNIRRALNAIGGTAGIAVSSFVLALLLLKAVSPEQFGIFSFMQVIVGLGVGVSNAIFGSPLLVAVNRDEKQVEGVFESFFRMNLVVCVLAGVVQVFVVTAFGEALLTGVLFALSAFFQWLRWFGRSYLNTIHKHNSVVISDVIFSSTVLVGAGVLYSINQVSITSFAGLQAMAAAFALLGLGWDHFQRVVSSIYSATFQPFLSGFKLHGRHALVGVVTTEATTNAHAYLVTILMGPAAFAPLAAALLFFRPIPIVIMSLTQVERPRLAQMLRDGMVNEIAASMKTFRIAVFSIWTFNIFLVFVFVKWFFDMVVAVELQTTMTFAIVFWALIMGLRCVRAPASAILQANGDFKPLAQLTVIASVVSLPLVYLMLTYHGAVWSLAGIVAGEMVAVILILRLASKMQASLK